MFVILVAVAILAISVAYLCLSGNQSVLAKRVKNAVSSSYIRWRKRKLGTLFHFDCQSTDVHAAGIVPSPEAWHIESSRPLSSHIHANDTVSICGMHQNGSVLVTRVTRRHDRRSEVWVYLRLASGKVYQLPGIPDANVYDTDGHSFSGSGLTLELLEPLFRWRVSFNGYLREIAANDADNEVPKTVNVRFSFIWRPCWGYVAFPHDFNADYMSEILSKRDWLKENFAPPWVENSEESLEQFGEFHGTLQIEDNKEERVLLRGLKHRRHGVLDWSNVKKKIAIHGVTREGTTFHLTFDENVNDHKSFCYGYVIPSSNMEMHHVTSDCIMENLKAFDLGDNHVKQLQLNMKTATKDYCFEFSWERSDGFKTYGGENWNSEIVVQLVSMHLNGEQGEAILEFARPNKETYSPVRARSLPLLHEPVFDANGCKKLIVSYDELECKSSKVVGGKAASLALLASLGKNHDFIVPEGIAVTSNAFDIFMDENGAIRKAVKNMIDVAWNRSDGVLSDECSSLVELISVQKLPLKVKLELQVTLAETFGDSFENSKFAVRSSAIGEDGEDTSAAGQNETYLGVSGLQEICSSIVKCWASQFSFRSVEYKRQNGQLLDGGMGVVVQKMVPADVAGVLFTRDPLTGSAASMVLTSNYGLGESVVSASADPDTIILKISWNGQLSVQTRQLGAKSTMITMSEDAGTSDRKVDEELAKDFSLSEDQALKLGYIALDLEKRFGNARDIEWAIKDGNVYLLQSRPVTTDGNFTDFEVIHEFNSTTRTDQEVYTTANVGEVLPGCHAPITTTFFRAQNCYFQNKFTWRVERCRFDPTCQSYICQFYGNAFVDCIQAKVWSLEEKNAVGKAMDIGIYGRILDDDDVRLIAFKRYENPSKKKKMMMTTMSFKGLLLGHRLLKNAAKKYNNYSATTKGAVTAQEAYDNVTKCIFDYYRITVTHYSVTMASIMWNLITMNMLAGSSEDFGMDLYTDFANLVGSANGAESGDVPYSLQAIVNAILQENEVDEFLQMSPEVAFEWLKKNTNETGKKFKEFIVKHGHRGLKEFDLGGQSWGMNPVAVVSILQTMSKSPASFKTSEKFNANDAIENLKSQLTPSKRWLLKWVMKGCRNGVVRREQAKSMMVKYVDGTRRGYQHLGELMRQEGYLPDAMLVVFMTHEEIGRLLTTRSAKLIRRAQHRRRVFAFKDKLQFPELSYGFPIPIQELEAPKLDGSSKVKGYPVSQGVVEALARVVPTFHDIGTIQPGEILITFSTDIGWSPYFPMLAGVVTEIGGLVSHGAVVAREFGLPCLVGAQGATKVFQSGDRIVLDATNGFVCKVE